MTQSALQKAIEAGEEPTRQALAIEGRSAKGQVTGRLKAAIDMMVWEGACRADAAHASGMTDHSLRAAMNKPHVLAYLAEQKEARRTSACTRNIARLEQLRDAKDNMVAVHAIRTLEDLGAVHQERMGVAALRSPGLQIVIVQPAPPAVAETDVIELQATEPAPGAVPEL